jgi:hypothetical protein
MTAALDRPDIQPRVAGKLRIPRAALEDAVDDSHIAVGAADRVDAVTGLACVRRCASDEYLRPGDAEVTGSGQARGGFRDHGGIGGEQASVEQQSRTLESAFFLIGDALDDEGAGPARVIRQL